MPTLYDYYTSQGKSLPSVDSRFSDPSFASAATKAGISKDVYTGTAEQNNAILGNLSTVAPIPQPTGVVSSTDKAQEFDANKGIIDKKTAENAAISADNLAKQNLLNADAAAKLKAAGGTTTPTPAPAKPTTSAGEVSGAYGVYGTDYAAAKAQADKDRQARIDEQTKVADAAVSRLGTAYENQKNQITTQFADLIQKQEHLRDLDIGRRQAYGIGMASIDPVGHTDAITQSTNEWNKELNNTISQRDNALRAAAAAYDEGKADILAKKVSELQSIENDIQNKLTKRTTELQTQLKVATEAINTKYKDYVERGKLAASRVVSLGLVDKYKNAKTPQERKSILDDALTSMGVDVMNPSEYASAFDSAASSLQDKIKSEVALQTSEAKLGKAVTPKVTGSGKPIFTFTPANNRYLSGAGFDPTDIPALQTAINTKGYDAVHKALVDGGFKDKADALEHVTKGVTTNRQQIAQLADDAASNYFKSTSKSFQEEYNRKVTSGEIQPGGTAATVKSEFDKWNAEQHKTSQQKKLEALKAALTPQK